MVAPAVGVLAMQGDFVAHAQLLKTLGVDAHEIRTAEQLQAVDALVLPGGESTTMSLLLERSGMLEPLRVSIAAGLPVLATCAGMILLAEAIIDGRPDQHCLGAVPITVRRNGYGRQLASFEAAIEVAGLDEPFPGIFIRAPVVEEYDDRIEVLASVDGHPVLCQYDSVTVASFHPELSNDARLHRRWLVDADLITEELS